MAGIFSFACYVLFGAGFDVKAHADMERESCEFCMATPRRLLGFDVENE